MHAISFSPSTPRDISAVAPSDQLGVSPLSSETSHMLALLSGRPLVALAVVLAWVASGLVIAYALGRRGHDMRALGTLGIALGPLLLGVARGNLIPRESAMDPIELAPGTPGEGGQRVLIAVLGPPTHVADAASLVRTLGVELGELILARPIEFEAAEDETWDRSKQNAAAALSSATAFLPDIDPRLLLVPGRSGRAIAALLHREPVDLVIVVGESPELAQVCREIGSRRRTFLVAAPEPTTNAE